MRTWRAWADKKVGIAVGVVLGVVLTLAVLAVVVVLTGGREEKRNTSARPVPRGRLFYTLRGGDVVRDPSAATRCEATYEGGIPYLLCARTPEGRYELAFYKDVVYIFRVGDPDNARILRWK